MEEVKESAKLNAVQRWMQSALITSGEQTNIDEIKRHINPSKTLSAPACLAIYQRTYYARLVSCLKEQYKALNYALGPELFADFSREYLLRYPSNSQTLSDLGARFSTFLMETRPDKEEEVKEPWVDFMIDLARFEWGLYQLFDAPGAEGSPYADENTREENLRLQPCFSLSQYDFPVSDFYRAVALKEEPEIPLAQPSFVAICRKNYQIKITHLKEPQFFFLQQLQSQKTVIETIDIMAENYDRQKEEVREAWKRWKSEWLDTGFFV